MRGRGAVARAARERASTRPGGDNDNLVLVHTNGDQMLAHTEESVLEDDILVSARERAEDLGADPVPPSVGALLSLFAQMLGARTVVEIGTGAGISGLWLLDGMRPDGVLTTIDRNASLAAR